MEIAKKDAGCGYYRLGKARVKLQQVIEVVQIKQTRTFILPFLFDAKQNTVKPRSAQVNLSRIPNCMRSISGKTGSLEDIKRFLAKYTHTQSHTQTALFGAAGGTSSDNEWHT